MASKKSVAVKKFFASTLRSRGILYLAIKNTKSVIPPPIFVRVLAFNGLYKNASNMPIIIPMKKMSATENKTNATEIVIIFQIYRIGLIPICNRTAI